MLFLPNQWLNSIPAKAVPLLYFNQISNNHWTFQPNERLNFSLIIDFALFKPNQWLCYFSQVSDFILFNLTYVLQWLDFISTKDMAPPICEKISDLF